MNVATAGITSYCNDAEICISFTPHIPSQVHQSQSPATIQKKWNNNNYKYISRALNPPMSNLHEAQSAVHVQLKLSKLHIQSKLSKQRNQQLQKENKKSRRWAGEGARSKY